MATVKLNVGGKLFETTFDTIQHSSYLKNLVKYNPKTDILLFIDRSYHIFKHVISLLRNPEYKYPSIYLDELDFYGIDIPLNLCDSNGEKLHIKCNNISKTLNNFTNDTTHDLYILNTNLEKIMKEIEIIKNECCIYSDYSKLD